MASQRVIIDLTQLQKRGLLRALRGGQHGAALRATIVLWRAGGESARSIAQTLEVTTRTVYGVRQRWRMSGLQGLADEARSGRPPRVTAIYLKLLIEAVETDPRQWGLAFSRWSRARLAAWLQQRTGVRLSARWVGELLRCHGFVWRRTQRTTRNLADPEEKRAGRSAPETPPARSQLAGGELRVVVRRRDPIRVIAGCLPDVAPPRHPPLDTHSRPEPPRRRLRRDSLPTRQFLFTHQPRSASTALFLPLLKRLVDRAQHTGCRIVLVLDNGVPFNSRLSTLAIEAAHPFVRVFRIPKYTSETLNWIENFWGHLKDTYFSRMLTEERVAFYPDTVRLLRRLRRSGRLKPLALRGTP
ncbi:helix-turn-helix domain-containing protein [Hyalangium versicolor]|uniref:helix-turn-helix domain-containing protein n=1 Tax=Hyalangium versicolor TaxID=2861190 RepID=UPI001CC97E45|nr:helix-turn-helix domain-containing protein [Hyalangium versicolor]